MNRLSLIVCATTLLCAGCMLPAPDELTFVDSSGPARLDGEGELSVSSFIVPPGQVLPDGPAGPNPQGNCRTNLVVVADDDGGDAAEGCSTCTHTFLVDFDIPEMGSPGTCNPGDFPPAADFSPYATGGDPPGPVQNISIGIAEDGAWWNGDGNWSLWIEEAPGDNSFDGAVPPTEWRNTGTESWVREELNFSWTTAAED